MSEENHRFDRSAASRRGSDYVRLAALAAVLAAAAYAAYRLGLFELRDPGRLGDAIRRARDVPALPLLFVLGYTTATVFGVPGTVFTLAGGAIFGTLLGSLLNWTGATLGALGAYALARRLGSPAVRNLLGRHARALDVLTSRAGFATLFRLRLIPVVPFNALNFAAGLAPSPFRAYAVSTALGIVPGTVVYTYFADSLAAGVTGARQRALVHAAIAGALLIALSFVPPLARRLRRNRH
ncbi:MAG: TVP38/TMEM64 family protein [Gemmatimonadaceae bacterium]